VTDVKQLAAAAKAIVDSNRYMTLATADENGVPWASPVWFASADNSAFFWVSAPEARHSHNLAARPQVGVIFDSQVPGGAGQAVYMSATAEEVAGTDIDEGIEIFSRQSEEQALPVWTSDQVLSPRDERLAVSL
jgi:nitroimidazol reductase NimA-like FMN-containing flavoprotein (pyridoxamine 5'-phosphate oxidase superfamily)